MDKKDIYEHLARIYLDASSKKKKKTKTYQGLFKNLFLLSIVLVFILGTGLFYLIGKNKGAASEVALVLLSDAAKINFNFDPAKKEIYSINLNNLNLDKFKSLGFSLKKSDYRDTISVRVEFINSFREKSTVYLKDIPHKWQNYRMNLSEFRDINDWSKMVVLSFTVEEWNVRQKKGIVYIDNIRLLK